MTFYALILMKTPAGTDESIERLDGARVRLGDVDDALVRSDLELLARFLVDERAA